MPVSGCRPSSCELLQRPVVELRAAELVTALGQAVGADRITCEKESRHG
jgi:hypothetical protein